MKKTINYLIILLAMLGCNENSPEYANLKLSESGIASAPEIEVLMQENKLAIKINLDGPMVYDTSFALTAIDAGSVYLGLKKMGVKIYSAGTPEWKNKTVTFFDDKEEEKSTELKELLTPYDSYFAGYYANLLSAARDQYKLQDQIMDSTNMRATTLDSLKAD